MERATTLSLVGRPRCWFARRRSRFPPCSPGLAIDPRQRACIPGAGPTLSAARHTPPYRGKSSEIENQGALKSRRLEAYEDVSRRTDRRIVDQRAHGDMDESTIPHHGIEQGAASPAMCVVGGLTSIDHQIIAACGDAELVARNAGKRLERRTGRPPAIRTMAIDGIFERIRHGLAHRSAKAFSGKNTCIRFS